MDIRVAAEQARVALINLFRENEIPMSDRNGRLSDTIDTALASLEAALAAQPEQQQGLVAAFPAAPQQPEADFDDPRVQTVYNLLCADEAPPKDSNEHWEGWLARRIVDALAASPAAAAQQSITKEQALESLSEVGLWLSRDPHALRLRQFIEQASPAAAAGVPTGWKLVPREPTPLMVQVAHEAESTMLSGPDIYRAMVLASPVAPVGAPRREAFEEWHSQKFGRAFTEWVEAKGRFAWDLTQELWQAWQAALLSAQGCELATDATKQQMFNGLTQEETDATASVMGLVHLAAPQNDQDFRRRPASSEAAPSRDHCADCGEHWDDHGFGIPSPSCPPKKAPK